MYENIIKLEPSNDNSMRKSFKCFSLFVNRNLHMKKPKEFSTKHNNETFIIIQNNDAENINYASVDKCISFMREQKPSEINFKTPQCAKMSFKRK